MQPNPNNPTFIIGLEPSLSYDIQFCVSDVFGLQAGLSIQSSKEETTQEV